MFTVMAVKNDATSYCENFVDFDSAKKAFDSINPYECMFADLLDSNYKELYGKYITACGDVQIWDRTI